MRISSTFSESADDFNQIRRDGHIAHRKFPSLLDFAAVHDIDRPCGPIERCHIHADCTLNILEEDIALNGFNPRWRRAPNLGVGPSFQACPVFSTRPVVSSSNPEREMGLPSIEESVMAQKSLEISAEKCEVSTPRVLSLICCAE